MLIFDTSCEKAEDTENNYDSLIARLQNDETDLVALDIRAKLTKSQLTRLFDAIKKNTHLSSLTLRGSSFDGYNLSDEYAYSQLAMLLKNKHHHLSALTLYHTGIDEGGAIAIASALKTNQKLDYLKISGHSINKTGQLFLIEMLTKNRHLNDFIFKYPGIYGFPRLALISQLPKISVSHLDCEGDFHTFLLSNIHFEENFSQHLTRDKALEYQRNPLAFKTQLKTSKMDKEIKRLHQLNFDPSFIERCEHVMDHFKKQEQALIEYYPSFEKENDAIQKFKRETSGPGLSKADNEALKELENSFKQTRERLKKEYIELQLQQIAYLSKVEKSFHQTDHAKSDQKESKTLSKEEDNSSPSKYAIHQPEEQDTESRAKPQNTVTKKREVYLIRPLASKPEQAETNQAREQELTALSKSLVALIKNREQYFKISFAIFNFDNIKLDFNRAGNSSNSKPWGDEFPQGKNIHDIKLDASEDVWLEAAWFVLLKNWAPIMISEEHMPISDLNAINISRNSLFRILSTIGSHTEQPLKLDDLKPAVIRDMINHTMPKLFSIFAMCKRVPETLQKQENHDVIEAMIHALQNVIARTIQHSTLESTIYYILNGKIPEKGIYTVSEFSDMCDSYKSIFTDEERKVLEHWIDSHSLQETTVGKSFLDLDRSLRENDIALFTETLSLQPVDQGYFEKIENSIQKQIDETPQIKNVPRL